MRGMTMKVLALVGSRRKEGNTATLVRKVMDSLPSRGWEKELMFLGDHGINGCDGCDGCYDTNECVIDDGMSEIYAKVDEADALVLGSPTYFYNVSSDMKAFIDRMYCRVVFHKDDRSVWTTSRETRGAGYAVTVSVCEQEDVRDMGFTADTMRMTLEVLGFRVVHEVKALHLFSPGEARGSDAALGDATKAGIRLQRSLELNTGLRRKNV